MEIEHLFRYPALAVGLKPSAMRGEARLRGLERAVADYLLKDHKPSASQGEARLRGLERAVADYLLKDHKPPAMRGLFLQRSQHLLLPAALTTGGTPDILAAYGHGMPCPCSHHQARR
jgi:hypothetical protein